MMTSLLLAKFFGSLWYYVLMIALVLALIIGLKIYRNRQT